MIKHVISYTLLPHDEPYPFLDDVFVTTVFTTPDFLFQVVSCFQSDPRRVSNIPVSHVLVSWRHSATVLSSHRFLNCMSSKVGVSTIIYLSGFIPNPHKLACTIDSKSCVVPSAHGVCVELVVCVIMRLRSILINLARRTLPSLSCRRCSCIHVCCTLCHYHTVCFSCPCHDIPTP